jgi:hypothetical protein
MIAWGARSATIAVLASSCSSSSSDNVRTTDAALEDLEARFSGFQAADEPNGNLAGVDWPSFVTDADAEVKGLYEFQINHGELMRFIPCYCGCGKSAGHRSNRDCYVKRIDTDGTVVLDSMAPT